MKNWKSGNIFFGKNWKKWKYLCDLYDLYDFYSKILLMCGNMESGMLITQQFDTYIS